MWRYRFKWELDPKKFVSSWMTCDFSRSIRLTLLGISWDISAAEIWSSFSVAPQSLKMGSCLLVHSITLDAGLASSLVPSHWCSVTSCDIHLSALNYGYMVAMLEEQLTITVSHGACHSDSSNSESKVLCWQGLDKMVRRADSWPTSCLEEVVGCTMGPLWT